MERTPEQVALVDAPVTGGEVWRDYAGNDAWCDYRVDFDSENEPTIAPLADYTRGRGLVSQADAGGTRYFHADLIGSTRLMTGPAGSGPGGVGVSTASLNYTAFGEVLPLAGPGDPSAPDAGTRYGYAGAWGYQNDALAGAEDIGLIHVGARYYDPASGRFVMRDRLGVEGGINVYAYCDNNPLITVDPSGLATIGELAGAAGAGARMYASAMAVRGTALAFVYRALGPALAGGFTAWGMIRTPIRGIPNSSEAVDDEIIRLYGPNGEAEWDYDFGPDHKGKCTPHKHRWDMSKKPPRQGPESCDGTETW